MSNIPNNLHYTKEHEWISGDSGNVRIGITDFAQAALGDIVYIQLPKIGDLVTEGKVCGEVESTKSVSEIFSPVTGVVVNVNNQLESSPEIINSDPYGAGWIAEIEIKQAPLAFISPADYINLTA